MSNDIQQFIIAVRRKMAQDDRYAPATSKSILKLVLMLEGTKDTTGALQNKKNRKPFLQAVTGLPLINPKTRNVSSALLTQHTVSVLIDEIQEVLDDQASTIHDIERLLEERAGSEGAQPWKLFPWEAPDSDLPTLF